MEKATLLLDYLKEQYAQARQHETRQTASVTFLTAAAGVVAAFGFKDGAPRQSAAVVGLIVAGIGLLGLLISWVHYAGNRFHTSVSGCVRVALERELAKDAPWDSNQKPSDLRKVVIDNTWWLKNSTRSVGSLTTGVLILVPVLTLVLGVAMAVRYWPSPPPAHEREQRHLRSEKQGMPTTLIAIHCKLPVRIRTEHAQQAAGGDRNHSVREQLA